MINQKTLLKCLPESIDTINVKGLGEKRSGKVRDWFVLDNLRILISTDRISAFDKVLGLIPLRGAVLNLLSKFWFDQTRDIVKNHMVGIIDPNVMLVTNCQALPIEVIVRGYITGVTDTSLWKKYERGERVIYGLKFEEGLTKNQKLKKPVITPTTRETGVGGHDEPITRDEILEQKIIESKIWNQIEKVAIALYLKGAEVADKAGFILADTKYEFGLDKSGNLILIDEVHTPDSSRYWVKKTYQEKFKKGEEVENYDKEFMRLWFAKQGYTGSGKPPRLPKEVVVKIATRYIEAYEKITGEKFEIDLSVKPKERIAKSLAPFAI